MKLKNIKSIKSYKSFNKFSWQVFFNNEIFHEGVNIFFGENGSGKSSICNLLKSISDNKDFGNYKPSETSLTFDDGEKKYSANDGWDNKLTKGSIIFFDREFVDKNVHLGHRRDTTQYGQEQESGKMIIEFDSDAINLRDMRDKTKKIRDEQNQKITDFTNANNNCLDFKLSDEEEDLYKNYHDKSEQEIGVLKSDLSKEKIEVESKYENDKRLQEKASNIQKDIKSLSRKDYNCSLSDYESFQALFNFDLKEQVKIEAEQSLVEKIKTHKTFFEAGFEIRKTHQEECPFCQSKNSEVEIQYIIDLYEKIYDTTFKNRLQKFANDKQILADDLSRIIEALSEFDRDEIFLELKKLDQNYKIPNIYSVYDESLYKKPTTLELTELSENLEKLEKPNKVNIQELYKEVKSKYETIIKFFRTFNNYIDEKNVLINKFKIDNTDVKLQLRISSYDKTISQINKKLAFFDNNKILRQRQKLEKEKELTDLKNEYSSKRTTYENALKEYEDHCSSKAFLKLLKKIQDNFKNFNFGFKLELKVDRTGNKLEFPFAFKVLDLEGNEREFKEGLSEGEIQVLSLCFFFAFLDIQNDKINKILIFDDPITSLDNSNLSCLVDLIAEEQTKFSQTFVLTHHKSFFKFLRKRFNEHCSEYNIIRNKKEFGGSFICKSKSEKFLEKLKNFESHLAQVSSQSLDVELKVVEYGQYLRYEIERYIKNSLLHWNANDFSTAIDGIKNNKGIADDDLDKIKQIYSFCNWTTSHIDINDDYGLGQLKSKIREFVAIVKI